MQLAEILKTTEPVVGYISMDRMKPITQSRNMDDLHRRYDDMWANALSSFKSGRFECDPLIDSPADMRRGLTLLGRISGKASERMLEFLDGFRELEPDQYFYSGEDLHLTVMSVVTCHEGFALSQIDPEDYAGIMTEVLRDAGPLRIKFKGITASPSCIMVQGFPENDQLNLIRETLRESFGESSVFSSIDSRYRIITAHSTVIRFRKPVLNGAQLIQRLEASRDSDFGSVEIGELEFVYNDWYQRAANTVKLNLFML